MRAQHTLTMLIRKYGMDTVFCRDGIHKTAPYRALLQPVRYKNKMYLQGGYSRIGRVEEGYYLYMGPAAVDVGAGDHRAYLINRAGKFLPDRVERVYWGEEILYVWAIVRSVTEEEDA